MYYRITIDVHNKKELAQACREVANQISKGICSGFIGRSDDSWDVEQQED